MTSEGATVLAASVSVRGRDHVRASLPNQDAGRAWRTKSGGMIAVADGLGSRPHAALGARAAVTATYRAVQAWRRHPQAGERELVLLIEAYWRLLVSPVVPDACASTAAFVAHFGGRVILGSLGDSLVMACTADEVISLAAPKEKYLNETLALGTAHKLADWQVRITSSSTCLALAATDGLSSDLDSAKHLDFLRTLGDQTHHLPASETRRVLRRMLDDGPRNGDDKTLALMWSAR
jgi:Protein phosphatase 2C